MESNKTKKEGKDKFLEHLQRVSELKIFVVFFKKLYFYKSGYYFEFIIFFGI